MILNVIMAITMYPTLLIVFLVIRYSMKDNAKYHYGVSLKKEWLDSDTYREVEANYRKWMNIALVLAILGPIPAFFTSSMSIQYTIWMVWFVGFIFAFEAPYVLAFNRLKAFKKQMLGLAPDEKLIHRDDTVYVDLEAVENTRGNVIMAFLPQLFICAAAVAAVYLLPVRDTIFTSAYMRTCRLMVVVFAAVTLLAGLIVRWVDGAGMQVISTDSRVNANYNRAKKKAWRSCWLQVGWINTALTLLIAVVLVLGKNVMAAMLWGSVAECFFAFFPIAKAIRQINTLQKKYEPNMDPKYTRDDEDYWIWGSIYYNPHDPRTLVEQRFSMGMTINMAKPVGIAVEIFAVAALVIVIPVSCVWMYIEERTPKQVYVENAHVICEDQKISYDIPLDEVTSAEWKALPKDRSKTNGSNWPDFEKGRYYEYWEKDFYEFCYTNQEEIILLTVGEDKYFISCSTAEETRQLMLEILAEIP